MVVVCSSSSSRQRKSARKVCVVVVVVVVPITKKKERGVMALPIESSFLYRVCNNNRAQKVSPSFLFVSLPLPPQKKRKRHMFRVYNI